jgi:hypothetical protein
MSHDPVSNRAKPNHPPDPAADAWAARVISVRAQGQNGQLQAMLTARGPGWRGEPPLTTARNVPMPHQQKIREHSIPIALAAGGAV